MKTNHLKQVLEVKEVALQNALELKKKWENKSGVVKLPFDSFIAKLSRLIITLSFEIDALKDTLDKEGI